MNFSEELAVAGELELTDSELETVSGGFRRWGRDYDDFEPYWYRPIPPWWLYDDYYGDEGGWGWGGGREWGGREWEGRRDGGGEEHGRDITVVAATPHPMRPTP